MKFGQLIEYNMRNIFAENSYAKCGEETIPGSFYKKIKIEYISESIVSRVIQFLLYANLRAIEIWCNQAADHVFSRYIKLF